MSSRHINLKAYDEVEKLNNFGNELENYKKNKLIEAQKYVSFIRKLFLHKKINVLELGSGNSSSLFALNKAEILRKGYGVEISKSRHNFAEKWKSELHVVNVENINSNVFDIEFKRLSGLDLCMCIDFAFQTFEPVDKIKTIRLIRNIYSSMDSGGKILIELNGYSNILNQVIDGKVKFWEEFATIDPWRFCLSECDFFSNNKFFSWRKLYLKRNELCVCTTDIILRIYSKKEITNLLSAAGFKNVKFYSNWHGGVFKNDGFKFIVIGEKK